jgi:L-ascorbate metabolism protein UlaG (beta-lactamase superfamily)
LKVDKEMDDSLKLQYIGHSTVMIEMNGVRLLTDPVLRNWLGFLRRYTASPNADCCESIDAVLVSHLHFDHLDIPSLRMLGSRTRIIVPHGGAAFLRRKGFKHVDEFRNGETIEIDGVAIKATPAYHSEFRFPFGPVAECIGYMIRGSRNIYFAGDTDLFPEMEELKRHPDIALLPVWGWGPLLGEGHMDPRRAAHALRLLHPRMAIPIHWGTFYPFGLRWLRLGFLTEPPYAFAEHTAEIAPDVEVRILEPGESLHLAAEFERRSRELVTVPT